jgi:LuxR family transcriptional regulator, glucitol operon activator
MLDKFINLIPPHVRNNIRDHIVDTLAEASSDNRWRKLINSFRSDAEFREAFDEALGRALQRFTTKYHDKALVEALTHTRFWDLPRVQNALIEVVTRPSSFLEPERDTLFHSFADVVPTIDPERVNQALGYFLQCLGDEVTNIPQLAPIYQVQLHKISLEQARQMVATLQELQRDQRQWMTALLESLSQTPLLLAAPADQPATLARPKVYHNLPPRYGEMLGREQDVARVLEGLGTRYPLISIEGMAGIGKTTLAIETAYSCLPGSEAVLNPPFETVVWVSAKDRPEQKQWLNEVLDTIARVLDYPAITQMPLEQKPTEVDQLLRSHRALVIVDNFETIEDPELVTWIQLVPEPSKALITTRYGQLRRAWDIHLGGLEGSEALALIRKNARRLGLQPVENAAEEVLLPLVRVTEGNPKAIEMALGYIKRGRLSLDEVVEHLYAASKSVEGLFDDLFAHFWNKVISRDAQQILMVSSFFVNSASKEALEATSGLVGYHLDSALEQLVDLALLDINKAWVTSGQHYSIHPLTRAFASAKLREVPEFEEQARQRWSTYYVDFATRSLVREKPQGRYWNTLTSYDVLKFIDTEWSNLQQVLAWVDQHGQDQLLVELMMLLVHYMGRRLRNAPRIYYVQRAANAANRLGQNEDEALFRIDGLGWVFIEECRYVDAEREIMIGRHIAKSIDNGSSEAIDLIALANIFLARTFLEQGDIENAVAFMNQVDPTKCKPLIQHRVYTIAANIAQEKNDNQEAIRLYERAIPLSQEYGGEGMGFELNYRLGFAYLANGDLARAESMFNEEVLVGEPAGVTIEVMYAKYGQASVARAKGERDKALQLARETKEQLSRLVHSHRLLNQLDDFLKSFEVE